MKNAPKYSRALAVAVLAEVSWFVHPRPSTVVACGRTHGYTGKAFKAAPMSIILFGYTVSFSLPRISKDRLQSEASHEISASTIRAFSHPTSSTNVILRLDPDPLSEPYESMLGPPNPPARPMHAGRSFTLVRLRSPTFIRVLTEGTFAARQAGRGVSRRLVADTVEINNGSIVK